MRSLPTVSFGLLMVVAVSGAMACSTPNDSYPPPVELQTLGFATGCAGFALDATLHGDPTDPSVTWLDADGSRVEVFWPPGYHARFVPELIVTDDRDRVVLREGSTITGGCSTEEVGVVRLSPPFDQ